MSFFYYYLVTKSHTTVFICLGVQRICTLFYSAKTQNFHKLVSQTEEAKLLYSKAFPFFLKIVERASKIKAVRIEFLRSL